jgi:hypothetical protein
VALTKDIYFIQKNLNRETMEAIEKVENSESLTSYSSFAQLRQELEV